MLIYFERNLLKPIPVTSQNAEKLKDAVWIDLVFPTQAEKDLVAAHVDFTMPTRADMFEIEPSSRLYVENNNLFMTATMLAQSDSIDPQFEPVTFMLTKKQLITIRYIDPQAFRLFISQGKKMQREDNPTWVLLELLDQTVERLADVLELVGHRIDLYSKNLCRTSGKVGEKRDYQQFLQEIGADGDLNTKSQESLISFNRLSTFLAQNLAPKIDNEKQKKLVILAKDIASLSDHAHFLSTKVNFLLDATLGLIGIEQNNIIKIFSIAAVIFLPPTLIASIYGMNFQFMPELNWKYGYLGAIGLILFAAWLPYKYFKYKKWL